MVRLGTWLTCQRGQTTAEYALVLLVAALLVGVFATFVRSGSMTELFESVVSGLVDRARA